MPKVNRENFKEPVSWADADDRRLELIGDIEVIECQLGRPFFEQDWDSEHAYHVWRQNAKLARVTKLQELRLINQWQTEWSEQPQYSNGSNVPPTS
jgi:hypothetical protein